MCLLAIIDPKKNIDFEALRSASHVNGDGFGIAVVDRGRIHLKHVVRGANTNDPEEIFKILEDAKDHLVMLHLRHKTQGDIAEKNAHPFWVTTHSKWGEDIVMGHNGTMSGFDDPDDKTLSDTFVFNRDVLQPLLQRELFVRKHTKGKKGPAIHDKYIRDMVLRSVPGSNRVAILDGSGNTLIINRGSGKEMPWGWASNDYSFNRYHREPEKKAPASTPLFRFNRGRQSDVPFTQRVPGIAQYGGNNVLVFATDLKPLPWITNDFMRQADTARRYMMAIKDMPFPNTELAGQLMAERPKFKDIVNIPSIVEATKMSPDNLKSLKKDAPDVYDILVQDLLAYVIDHETPIKGQSADLNYRLTRVVGGAI